MKGERIDRKASRLAVLERLKQKKAAEITPTQQPEPVLAEEPESVVPALQPDLVPEPKVELPIEEPLATAVVPEPEPESQERMEARMAEIFANTKQLLRSALEAKHIQDANGFKQDSRAIKRALTEIGNILSSLPKQNFEADLQAEKFGQQLEKIDGVEYGVEAEWILDSSVEAEAIPKAAPEAPPEAVPQPLPQEYVDSLTAPADLEAARKKYAEAKKKMDGFSSIKVLLHISESKEKVETALVEARKEYEMARAEYVGAHVGKFIEEKTKLVEAQMQEYTKGKVAKFAGWYKSLADHNVLDWYENKKGKKVENKFARFALRTLNPRTGLAVGLGLAGFALGPGSFVGLGVWGARKGLSFAGTSTASYELINAARNSANRGAIEKKLTSPALNSNQLEEYMAGLEARAILDGKTAGDLKKDDLYLQLLSRYEGLMTENVSREDDGTVYLDRRASAADSRLDQAKRDEKSKRVQSAVVAGQAGVILSSGYLQSKIAGKLLHHVVGAHVDQAGHLDHSGSLGGDAHPTERIPVPAHPDAPGGTSHLPSAEHPTPPAVVPTESLTPEAPTVDSLGTIEVPMSSRGLESSLLNLQKTNPDQYAKMLSWLNEHYHSSASDGNTPDKLLHRFVLDHKQYDFSHLLKGSSVSVGQNGEIILDPDKMHFYTVDAAAEHSTAGGTPEAVSVDHSQSVIQEATPATSQAHEASVPVAEYPGVEQTDPHLTPESIESPPSGPFPEPTIDTVTPEHTELPAADHVVTTDAAPLQSHDLPTSLKDIPDGESLPHPGEPLLSNNVDILRTLNTSEALSRVLEGTKFQELLSNSLNLSAEQLNKVGDQTLQQFIDNFADDDNIQFQDQYKDLAQYFIDASAHIPEHPLQRLEFIQNTSVKDFLLKIVTQK